MKYIMLPLTTITIIIDIILLNGIFNNGFVVVFFASLSILLTVISYVLLTFEDYCEYVLEAYLPVFKKIWNFIKFFLSLN